MLLIQFKVEETAMAKWKELWDCITIWVLRLELCELGQNAQVGWDHMGSYMPKLFKISLCKFKKIKGQKKRGERYENMGRERLPAGPDPPRVGPVVSAAGNGSWSLIPFGVWGPGCQRPGRSRPSSCGHPPGGAAGCGLRGSPGRTPPEARWAF